MRAIFFLVFFLLLSDVYAQQAKPLPSFIKKDQNRLYHPQDSSAFISLYRKMAAIGTDKPARVNIVHMGGSHVQGGTWSNTFISDLQKTFITGGGGYYIFPYKIAKTNGQPFATSFSTGTWKRCRAVGKEFCLPLGMCAMNISTNDSANSFGVRLTDKASCKYVNVVKVYHNFNESFRFSFNPVDSFKVERNDFPAKGYSEFRFTMLVDSLNFSLEKLDTMKRDFVLFGFSFENDLASGFYLAALGANGASSSSFLRSSDLVNHLSSLNADLYILSLGVNDTQSKSYQKEEYIENYDSLIIAIRKASPGVPIILTTTTDNYIRRKTSNKRTISAREAMFELRDRHQVAIWDLFTIMGGYRSMPKWYNAGLASRDKVHFTGKGYVLLGDLMFEAFYTSYLQAKQNGN